MLLVVVLSFIDIIITGDVQTYIMLQHYFTRKDRLRVVLEHNWSAGPPSHGYLIKLVMQLLSFWLVSLITRELRRKPGGSRCASIGLYTDTRAQNRQPRIRALRAREAARVEYFIFHRSDNGAINVTSLSPNFNWRRILNDPPLHVACWHHAGRTVS